MFLNYTLEGAIAIFNVKFYLKQPNSTLVDLNNQ